MTPDSPELKRLISLGTQLLRAGGLVAFPTETVYGLGADASNSKAVRKIFNAKGRPSTNPLIVHVSDARVARRYVTEWTDAAQRLADAFWPGPLTLVLPKAEAITPEVTAGLDSVGLRVPDHPLALALLREFDGPVAAPSANRANRVSPTTAEHVRSELGDAVDLILDGGPCRVGIESTVLDLTAGIPTILRPGGVTRERIARVVGDVRDRTATVDQQPATSPGQGAVHYAPVARAWRFSSDETQKVLDWIKDHPRSSALLITPVLAEPSHYDLAENVVRMPPTPSEYARHLYSALRKADGPSVTDILIELPPDEPQWHAVHDRLRRATRPL